MTELVWSRSRARRGSLLVMLALAREADDQGKVALSLEQIAKLTRLSARAVTNCLPELAALEELTYIPGAGRAVTNQYSILLGRPDTSDARPEPGNGFREPAAATGKSLPQSPKPLPGSGEPTSPQPARVSTPVGSTNPSPKPAGQLSPRPTEPGGVPAGARDVVAALTDAGMVVGWRLTEDEWARVTALSARWGAGQLAEVISRRWDPNHPPQSARYLLRIWDDLPTDLPANTTATTAQSKLIPLRREPGGWKPYRNSTQPSAFQNGF